MAFKDELPASAVLGRAQTLDGFTPGFQSLVAGLDNQTLLEYGFLSGDNKPAIFQPATGSAEGEEGTEGSEGANDANSGLQAFAPNTEGGLRSGAAGHPSGQGSTNGAFSGQSDASTPEGDPNSVFGKVVTTLAKALMPLPMVAAIEGFQALDKNDAHAKLGFLDKDQRRSQLVNDLTMGILGTNSNIDAKGIISNRSMFGMPANVLSGNRRRGSMVDATSAQAMSNAVATQAAVNAMAKNGLSTYGKYGGNVSSQTGVTPSTQAAVAAAMGAQGVSGPSASSPSASAPTGVAAAMGHPGVSGPGSW